MIGGSTYLVGNVHSLPKLFCSSLSLLLSTSRNLRSSSQHMEIPMLHPSARPAAQKGQLMVSNFFDVLEDQSYVQDSAVVRALSEHPEVEAPHALREHPEVVAPQIYHSVYSPVVGNSSKLIRTVIKHCANQFTSDELRYSFATAVRAGEVDTGSRDLLAKFFDAGLSVSSALAVLISRGSLASVGGLRENPNGAPHHDRVRSVIDGSIFSDVTAATYVARKHRTPYVYRNVRPMYYCSALSEEGRERPYRPYAAIRERQFVKDCPNLDDYINAYGSTLRDSLYYSGIHPWLQSAIKAGSFNPYGNGQPAQGKHVGFYDIDDTYNSPEFSDDEPTDKEAYPPENWGLDGYWLRNPSNENDGESNVHDTVERIFDEQERKRIEKLTCDKGIFPIIDTDMTLGAIRLISPIATLFYQLYNSKNKVDALVAAWSYIERMSVEDNYSHLKCTAGWAAAFIVKYKAVVELHLGRAYEFIQQRAAETARSLKGKGFMKIQSSEGVNSMMEFLTQITVGAQTNARAQSFIWLISFLFTSISAAKSGVFVSFTEYSKKSKDLVDRCFALGASGVTVSLFVIAVRHCYEMVSDLFTDGVKSLWRTEVATVSELRVRGKALLARASLIDITTDFGEVTSFGIDIDRYLHDVDVNSPSLSTRQLGINAFGIGMSSETNTAILWASVKKLSAELKVANQRYKLLLAGISYKKAPFCMAAVGGSSLGKSLFTQSISAYINGLLGVKHDPLLIYTFNPGTDYMDGYKPFQTIAVLDDVATMRPEYCKDGDPQAKMLISMVNNVPFLTPQADLPDKKTHPFLSRAVILTSNSKTFNTDVYATNPAALMRRVRYRIELHIHQDFVNGVGGLDQTKARNWSVAQPTGGASFPPFWEFTVEELVAVNVASNTSEFQMRTDVRTLHTRVSTHQFLSWFRTVWREHEANQTAAVDQVKELVNMSFCPECHLPHPYHDPTCAHAGPGAVLQSLDVTTVVNDWRFQTFAVCCVTFVITQIAWTFAKIVDGFFMMRDKSIRGLAMMEDASNNLSHMAHIWSKIGAPLALIVGTFGLMYSWVCVFLSIAYGVVVIFPTSRVRAVLSVKDTLMAATVMIAGGLMVRQMLKKDGESKRVQSRDEVVEKSTANFSSNDLAAKWGAGVCRPYTSEHLAVAYSPGTHTSKGDSQDGVLTAIKKAIFVCRITSSDGNVSWKSSGNGFVYSQNPPIIGINHHSLAVHAGKGPLKFRLMFRPNSSDTPIDGEFITPSDTFEFVVDRDRVYSNTSHDLTMVPAPGLQRRGVEKYFVLGGHENGAVGPRLIGRDTRAHLVERSLKSYVREKNVLAQEGPKIIDLPVAHSFVTDNPTLSGESGSLLVLHRGNTDFGEKGGVAIAGFHVGYTASSRRVCCAPLNSQICGELADKIQFITVNAHMRHIQDSPHSDLLMQCASVVTPHGVENNIFDLEKGSPSGLTDPHRKSAINWVEVDGSVQVFGGLSGDCRNTQGLRSGYAPTRWSHALATTEGSVLGNTVNNYMPTVVPQDRLWEVHHKTLHDLLGSGGTPIPEVVLDNAVAGFVEDIIDNVHRSGNDARWNNFGVITVDEAVNGIDGVLDSIVWKTGGGFGYSGAKRNQRVRTEHPIPGLNKSGDHYRLNEDTMKSVREADDMLRRGIDPGFVYQTHLKDEIRTRKKVLNSEIRMICGAPVPAIVLTRKYLASLIIFMSQNPLPTECAVGVNCESKQWGDLARFLKEYGGEDRFIAGDYKNFDKNQTLQMTKAVGQVMLALVLHAKTLYPDKYDDGDITAIKTLLSGLCYPRYDHFGTLLAICGSNPSGNSLTAQRNCVANSLYTRSSFIWLARRCIGLLEHLSRKLFTQVVRQINYGDDVVMAVREGFGWFNHDTISHALSLWGVPFTHADKSTDVGKPYDSFAEVTFLKRSFVFNDEIGDYLAPLALESVVKSLHYYCPRNSINNDAAHAEVLRASAENVLSHGRSVYDRYCCEAKLLASNAGLRDLDYVEATRFTTWDEFIDRFKLNSTVEKFRRFSTRSAPSPFPLVKLPVELVPMVPQ